MKTMTRFVAARFAVLLFGLASSILVSGCADQHSGTSPVTETSKNTTAGADTTQAASTIESVAERGSKETFLLRYRFTQGETLRWDVKQTIRVQTTLSGVAETIETSSDSTKTWSVDKVTPDGSAEFVYQVDDVDMSQRQTGKLDVRYNSKTDKEPPPTFKRVANSVGVPLARITINGFGETVKKIHLREYDASAEANRITIPLPKEPVAIGESWIFPCPIELPQPGGRVKKLVARQRFTLEGVKTGVATIQFETQILTPITEPEIEASLINSYAVGTLEFDIDAGRTLSQETRVDRTVNGIKGKASSIQHQTRTIERWKR